MKWWKRNLPGEVVVVVVDCSVTDWVFVILLCSSCDLLIPWRRQYNTKIKMISKRTSPVPNENSTANSVLSDKPLSGEK
jgi:hypothetical protein